MGHLRGFSPPARSAGKVLAYAGRQWKVEEAKPWRICGSRRRLLCRRRGPGHAGAAGAGRDRGRLPGHRQELGSPHGSGGAVGDTRDQSPGTAQAPRNHRQPQLLDGSRAHGALAAAPALRLEALHCRHLSIGVRHRPAGRPRTRGPGAGARQVPAAYAPGLSVPDRFNVIPQCDTFGANGYTGEETKMQGESRKVLGLPESQDLRDLRAGAGRARVAIRSRSTRNSNGR